MRKGVFQNTVVFVPVSKGGLIPLRLQFSKKALAVRAVEKGEMGTREALDLIESFHQYLDKVRIPHRSMARKTNEGRRIDMVVIPYQRDG